MRMKYRLILIIRLEHHLAGRLSNRVKKPGSLVLGEAQPLLNLGLTADIWSITRERKSTQFLAFKTLYMHLFVVAA